MQKLKRILLKIAMPPVVLTALLIPLGFGLVLYSAFNQENQILAYVSYGLSAYSLILLCFRIPGIIRFCRDFKTTNRFAVRYFSDAQYRVKLSLYTSLAINLLYVLLQLTSGILQNSIWFYALAVYYFILALMRFFLLKETVRHELGKDLRYEFVYYRFVGIMLLVMNLALGTIAAYIVIQNRGFEHSEIITIAMAAYTFYSLTMAIISVFRLKHRGSPIMTAAKHISLVAALVSMLSLETSMFSAFGQGDDPMLRMIMTSLTGAGVFLVVLGNAVFMIFHSTRRLKQLKGDYLHGE